MKTCTKCLTPKEVTKFELVHGNATRRSVCNECRRTQRHGERKHSAKPLPALLVQRTETGHGQIIRHLGIRPPVMGNQQIHWCRDHELCQMMAEKAVQTVRDPIGEVGRLWHVARTGKCLITRPTRWDVDGDEEEEEQS